MNLPEGESVTGTIVEDFSDMIPVGDSSVRIDEHRRAQPRRWGIAVDDQTLVFADDPDVVALSEDEDPASSE
ncbi:hypothetical protein D7316_03684 [Gordonia insulae]|uniref:Uncharacterized protein n=1 Tax=Gordonia insulae TaxID=2420509 RepID=A0A3G8JQ35_9ACTN|nr:hypothetical protein D7316_03684 [Gordonia insulae]